MKVLTIDIGGTNIKILLQGKKEMIKFPSGPEMTPAQMVKGVLAAAAEAGWAFDVVSMGYPGPVIDQKPALDPKNLGPGWTKYNFTKALGKPVKIINDAAMQALGSYDGGRMLFLGLGTGLGTAMVINNKTVVDLELAHLPYKKDKSFEQFTGIKAVKKFGDKKWETYVHDVVARLKAAMVADYVVLGGGNSKRLKKLPKGARLGENSNAFIGGFRLWEH
jgi:polyphosphate glucokinase